MSAKCRAWSLFGRDVTERTLPKVAFYAGWDAAHDYYSHVPPNEYDQNSDKLVVPSQPEPARIESMCLRYDHSFGLKRWNPYNCREETDEEFEQRREATRRTMQQLYEEATGQGFFIR